MQRAVESRWFSLCTLLLVGMSGIIWFFWPLAGWWPLIIALVPWTIRSMVGQFPFKPTVFDFALVIFLVTAGFGVWAAYNREAAWDKFWILLGCVLLFYALAEQPKENLWFVVGLLSVLGVAVAVIFALSHDWQEQPGDFAFLNQTGFWLMSARPALKVPVIQQNVAGGLLAMLLPFTVALGLHAWRGRSYTWLFFAIITGGILALGLLLTSSRGAWLALSIAFGFWILWGLSGFLARKAGRSRTAVFVLCLLIIIIVIVLPVVNYPGGLEGLADRLPGLPSGESRFDLARNTLYLIADFPFTGGGLGAFPGLYSRYIMVIRHLLFSYSHNFYLDVALEQGLLGLSALLSIFLGSVWILILWSHKNHPDDQDILLSRVALASLILVGFHGLVDDVLYGNQGTLLLFLLPGMAISMSFPRDSGLSGYRWQLAILVVLIVGFIVLYGGGKKLGISNWYANMGAVEMSRMELRGFPLAVDDGSNVEALAPAVNLFNQATQINLNDGTANYRLGLVAMRERDFEKAESNLARAYFINPGNRGVRKMLGYCYVWLGHIKEAAPILANIPEARSEMEVYAWWWGTQGRQDLANQAERMATLLSN